MLMDSNDLMLCIQHLETVGYHVFKDLQDLGVNEEHAMFLTFQALNRQSVVDSICKTARSIEENANLSYAEIIKKVFGGDDHDAK